MTEILRLKDSRIPISFCRLLVVRSFEREPRVFSNLIDSNLKREIGVIRAPLKRILCRLEIANRTYEPRRRRRRRNDPACRS